MVIIIIKIYSIFARKNFSSNFRQGKVFIQVYSNPDEYSVSLILPFDSNIRHVRQEAIQFTICIKMAVGMKVYICAINDDVFFL